MARLLQHRLDHCRSPTCRLETRPTGSWARRISERKPRCLTASCLAACTCQPTTEVAKIPHIVEPLLSKRIGWRRILGSLSWDLGFYQAQLFARSGLCVTALRLPAVLKMLSSSPRPKCLVFVCTCECPTGAAGSNHASFFRPPSDHLAR
jgi:hypothetical protein